MYIQTQQLAPTSPARSQVAHVIQKIKHAEKEGQADAARRKSNRDFFLSLQWPGETHQKRSDKARINVIRRHVLTLISALYAQDPRATVKLAEYVDWGDDLPLPPDPRMVPPEILMLRQHLQQQKQNTLNLAKTLQNLLMHFTMASTPNIKSIFKQAIVDALVDGGSAIVVRYDHRLSLTPAQSGQAAQLQDYIRQLQSISHDVRHDPRHPDDGRLDQIRQYQQQIQQILQSPAQISGQSVTLHRYGLDDVILDPETTNIRTLEGCGYIALRHKFTRADLQARFGVDLRHGQGQAQIYQPDQGWISPDGTQPQHKKIDVFEVYDRTTGMVSWVSEVWPEYLRAPAPLPAKLPGFFPIHLLCFNYSTDPELLWGESDTAVMRYSQEQINRQNEALRKAMWAAMPRFAVMRGALSDRDARNLAESDPFSCTFINMPMGGKVNDVFQPAPTTPFNPQLYTDLGHYAAIDRLVGTDAAAMGAVSGSTATEASIAASARNTHMGNNADEFDDFLSAVFQTVGIFFRDLYDGETVRQLVGPLAYWSQHPGEVRADFINIRIQAKSSGKRDDAQQVIRLTQLLPLLQQMPNLNLEAMIRRMAGLLDIQIDEFLAPGTPSLLQMQAIAGAQGQAPPAPAGVVGQIAPQPANDARPPPHMSAPNMMAPAPSNIPVPM